MADCLPGIGAKTRAQTSAHLRSGNLSGLKPAQRRWAQRWFETESPPH
jgi:hypothetical protein